MEHVDSRALTFNECKRFDCDKVFESIDTMMIARDEGGESGWWIQ